MRGMEKCPPFVVLRQLFTATTCATCARRGIGLFLNKTILLGNYAKTLPLQARQRIAEKQMF